MGADDYVGKTIAEKFRVEQLIGEGGMGRVFKATHLALDKAVCLKVLRKTLLSDDRTVARFQREAKAASRLNHPNSISIIDFGTCDDGALYIAMEYVAGEDLHQVLSREGPLPERRVIRVMAQVLSALAEAHAAGVIHRDLKPENIMVVQKHGGETDFVKVLDFGIAKIQEMPGDEPSMALTRAGFVCGTPEYMSPEQARGASLDARSDLYAVGVILYQALTGLLPFESESAVGFATMHLTQDPIPPRQRRPDLAVSEPMEALVLGAMAKDPNDRPQTAEQFKQDLVALGDPARLTPLPTETTDPSTTRRLSSGRVRTAPPPEVGSRRAPTRASGQGPRLSGSAPRGSRVSSDRTVGADSVRRRVRWRRQNLSAVAYAAAALTVGAGVGLWAFSRLGARAVPVETAADPAPARPDRKDRSTRHRDLDLTNPSTALGTGASAAAEANAEGSERTQKLVTVADDLFRKGEVKLAIRQYEQAHRDAPSPALALKLAMCHLHQADRDEARRWLETYARKRPRAADLDLYRKHVGVLGGDGK